MNEERILLKGKLSELKSELLKLRAEGSGIIKQLSRGLNLNLHDEISEINIEEINALTERLNQIHEKITEIKKKINRIGEELGE